MGNIPEAGLAIVGGKPGTFGSPEQMAKLAAVLNMPFDVAAQITPEIRHELLVAFKGPAPRPTRLRCLWLRIPDTPLGCCTTSSQLPFSRVLRNC